MGLVQTDDLLELRSCAPGRTEFVLGVSRYDQVLVLLELPGDHGHSQSCEGAFVALHFDESFLLVPRRLAIAPSRSPLPEDLQPRVPRYRASSIVTGGTEAPE